MTIIDCIADLHGYEPKLSGGDLLIIAGDSTAADSMKQWTDFFSWLKEQPYKKKILIAGNHDNLLESMFPKTEKEAKEVSEVQSFLIEQNEMEKPGFEYLCDSGIEFEGLKIWGSPWTKTFSGMNPKCKAFTVDTDKELAEKWRKIPDDLDILITHSPPNGILDGIIKYENTEHTGSLSLRNEVMGRIKPRYHIFGHIHEWGGKELDTTITHFINASYVNERYEPVNNPKSVIF